MNDKIVIHGAREHNLKNIDLEIPRDKLIVLTGLSGSGKSSLAFDTIYADGQRRYMESLSSYARQFLGMMEKPDVDEITGLSPAISIDQKTTSKNPRSTVGTVTEIYDYLRLLYARIGIPHCPICGREIRQQTVDQMVDKVLELPERTKIQILAPIVRGKKGMHQKEFERAKKSGYVRVRVDGSLYELSEEIKLDKNKKHNIEIVVDRLVVRPDMQSRLTDSLETAIGLTGGLVIVDVIDGEEMMFSQNYACPEHNISIEELNPRMFSFNNPFGACEKCTGLGTFMSIVSQMLSGTALITSMVEVAPSIAMLTVLLLMIAYVVFGGAWGAGMVGMVKTLLLYVTTFVCGIVSLRLAGGFPAFQAALPHDQYFNLFARGYWKDGGAGASLIFGVLTTQAYILPVVSAKNLRTSKAGAILGGFLTVLIGIAGIFVGMFMRMEMPDISSASALPVFALTYLPGFLGGVILATLLVALVGTGAGLSLGVSSMLYQDIYKPFIQPNASDKTQLRVSRGIILALLLAAALFSMGKLGSLILSWGFLSMGLRGAVAFAPLCFALFSPGRIRPAFAGAAIIAGPLLVLLGSYILPPDIDPLFLGMAAALLITFIGWLIGPKK